MTVYFRLLAGFTSFISKRCLSHLSSIGPDGILAFSSMRIVSTATRSRSDQPDAQPAITIAVNAEPDEDRQHQRHPPPERARATAG